MSKKKRKKKQAINWRDTIREHADKLTVDMQKLKVLEDLPCGKQLPPEPSK